LLAFAVLFLISGCAGLIYEIVWEKVLELYFGVTMVAVTLIVAAYMGGMGIGSLVGGRIAGKLKSVLFLYGLVELGIATFGLASLRLIAWVGQAMAGSPYVLVFILSFLLLLIPTFLMGMTLPLLTQAFISRVDISGQVIGLLYGINTLGAAFGSGLAGYFFIGRNGFNGTAHIAVILNALIGLAAIAINFWKPAMAAPVPAEHAARPGIVRWGYRRILFASFLVGFIGLGYEMLWIRVLSIINKSTVYNFPTILVVFLGGLALGGYYWGRRADLTTDPVRLFWKVEVGAAIIVALVFLAFYFGMKPPAVGDWIANNFNKYQRPASPMVMPREDYYFSRWALFYSMLNYLPPVILMVLPASLILGGGLPILDRIAIESPEVAGRRVGDIHLANIVGSVFGTLTISFILLPTIGSELTLKVLLLLGLVFLGLYLIARKTSNKNIRIGWQVWAAGGTVLLLLAILPGKGQFYTRLYETAIHRPAIVRETGETVLALELIEENRIPARLWIGGETNSVFPGSGAYEGQAMACAGASQPKRVLVIGLGGGNSAYFYTTLPGIEKIVIVELIPDLAPFLTEHVAMTRALLNDPHIEYVTDDGRRYLYSHPGEKFDLISLDPVRNFTSGHNSLYSTEALELYQTHLSPAGILCQWQDEWKVLPRTVASVFPYVDHYDGFTVAGNEPIHYDLEYMSTANQQFADIGADFVNEATVSSTKPQVVFIRFIRDRGQILDEEQDTPLLRDFSPWLEYYLFHKPKPYTKILNEAALADYASRILGCDADCQKSILRK
jgi:spermidine synthase